MSMKTRRLTTMALLLALALILSALESMIPPITGMIPGIKMGLSNIVVMYTLLFLGLPSALLLAVMKALFVLSSRGLLAAALSLCGGVSSILVMFVLMQLKKANFSYIFLSICGATTHNIVQLGLAVCLTGSVFAAAYLPVLVIAGVAMGIVTGTILRTTYPLLASLDKKDKPQDKKSL